MSTAFRTCSLCEATCGLRMEVADGAVAKVRGDADDVLSAGYLCPKGASLPQLHADPDRLRAPLIRAPGEASHREATWDEAFAHVDALLRAVIDRDGPDAVAVYVGNPSGHDLSATLYHRVLHRALGTRNLYTVGTADQLPKSLACALMFGSPYAVPVPDLDRTGHLLILGANPAVSNGSLVVAPNLRRRIAAIRERGGRVVVIDPRRTRTAREADAHHFIRPGTDAALLAAMAHVILSEGRARLGRLAEHVAGLEALDELVARFPPERVAPACGIAPDAIRGLARELASAERPVVYARIGTTTQAFGSMASWLVDVLNVLIGALDAPGGAMFGTPAAHGPTSDPVGSGRGVRTGRWHARVSRRPEVLGELPVGDLAGEIATPGDGRVRALLTLAGNPVLSTPDGPALDAALGSLEAMVSHDLYVNETTRHAHVILPATSPLERPHYPLGIYPNGVRNVANWSPAVLGERADRPADWEIVLRLAAIVGGAGPAADVAAMDDDVARRALERRVRAPGSSLAGRDPDELLSLLAPRRGPARMVDLLLRAGPYGDAFGARPDGLTLAALEAAPHGVDLGPLEPRLPGILRTPSGKVELAPAPLVAEGDRLEAVLDATARDAARAPGALLLVGRREPRSMNSWLHNLPNLTGGRGRCTLLMHPDDATRAGVRDGDDVRVAAATGAIVLPLEVSDEMMPGVVSAPHGFGHERDRTRQPRAAATVGANVNRLHDRAAVDEPSGTAVLSGVPVTVAPVTTVDQPIVTKRPVA